jgi:hypothetical protein
MIVIITIIIAIVKLIAIICDYFINNSTIASLLIE